MTESKVHASAATALSHAFHNFRTKTYRRKDKSARSAREVGNAFPVFSVLCTCLFKLLMNYSNVCSINRTGAEYPISYHTAMYDYSLGHNLNVTNVPPHPVLVPLRRPKSNQIRSLCCFVSTQHHIKSLNRNSVLTFSATAYTG